MNHCINTLLTILAAGLLVAVMTGCGAQATYAFDELDSMPAQDELIEFPLGTYSIPIPLVQSFDVNGAPKRNSVEFSFELHALVTRDGESQLAGMWRRHEGKLRDRVIQVCRNAKLEDLQEPELATLKSHLVDAVQAELGPKSIRRLLVSEVVTQKL